jgi:hypothetical protein
MRTNLKPVLTLLLITPCLTELLSNNMPPQMFFQPVVFLLLATVAYGFPVLLLREFACRNRLGLPGLLCLGLVYGIINEGIFAKTFYLAEGVPVRTFDHFGYVAGISIPWAITISVWHSLHALLCPMLATYFFFPAQRDQPWLTRSGAWWLAIPTIALNTLVFFSHSNDRAAGHLFHFVLMLAGMGFLTWLATKAPRSGQLTAGVCFRLKPLACGAASFLMLLLVPVLLSKAKVDLWLFYGYFAVVCTLVVAWLARQPTIPVTAVLLFMIGNNLVTLFWAMPSALGRADILQLVADALLVMAFALLLVRVWKDSRVQPTPGNNCAA